MAWLVGRYDGDMDYTPEREAELIELVKQHGLEPADLMRHLAISSDSDGQHRMHVSRLLSGPDGKGRILDFARYQAASEPVVVEVAANSWPSWLTALNTRKDARPEAA